MQLIFLKYESMMDKWLIFRNTMKFYQIHFSIYIYPKNYEILKTSEIDTHLLFPFENE